MKLGEKFFDYWSPELSKYEKGYLNNFDEIWKFGRNLLFAKFGSERVKELFLAVSMNFP